MPVAFASEAAGENSISSIKETDMSDSISGMKRSHGVAEITAEELGQELTLMGWCHRQRDIGKIIFLTLRDRSGELQLVVDETAPVELLQKARTVRAEYVLAVRGILRKRENPNPDMPTGDYELLLTELRILAESKTPPFYIEDGIDARESLRLEYRSLDLRRTEMQKTFMLRHKITAFTRRWFDKEGFLDIETPFLIKPTPEGARDYLVPSRIFPGTFFALPQSPQIYKQLLMCAGFDRYMQLAKCFRDEDLRADRQPEFTQIDMEMSFVQEEDVHAVIESFLRDLFAEFADTHFPNPVPVMTWREAMRRFGSDKPDCRFSMEIADLSEVAAESEFKIFQQVLAEGGRVLALAVPGGSDMKRRRLDELTQFVRDNGGSGLVWMSVEESPRGSAAKFLDADWVQKAAAISKADTGDMLLIVADQEETAQLVLGRLRLELARSLKLIPENSWAPLWVTEFPMYERDSETGRLVSAHHPFTMPMEEDIDLLDSDPCHVRSQAYDFVINGYEIGSGSVRIHDQELQSKIFTMLGFSREEAQRRFGFLLKAFEYGVPPHAGMALGLDRLVMLLRGTDNIRDVIAFPKVQNSSCLMSKCPTKVDASQLEELGICIAHSEDKKAEPENVPANEEKDE